MRVSPYIEALHEDLVALAAGGDEAATEAARRLLVALDSSLRLRLFDLIAEAALELNGKLPSGHVEVRLAGRDPEFVYLEDSPAGPPGGEDASIARITLRLPEALKASVEAAAAREGVSVNAWLVQAVARSLAPRRGPRRLTGYGES